MYLKYFFGCFLNVAFFLNLAAQATKAMGQNDPEAKKVLDAASNKVKTYKTMKVNFSFSLQSANNKTNDSKKGSMLIKASKYVISFTDKKIFCDGTTVWTYDKTSNEVTITKFDNSSNSITPQKLFTNFYDKDFLYKLNTATKVLNKPVQEIEMTPIDKSKSFFKVLLWIDKTTNTIAGAKVFNNDGNKYTINITTLVPNTTVKDEEFVFDQKKYPGVEVVDLR